MKKSKFNDILAELQAMHDRKGQDYGTDEDDLANVRASSGFGVAPWVGAMVRLNDKIVRIQSFLKKGRLANESLEDSLIDIAVYSIIALQLYREQNALPTTAVGSVVALTKGVTGTRTDVPTSMLMEHT